MEQEKPKDQAAQDAQAESANDNQSDNQGDHAANPGGPQVVVEKTVVDETDWKAKYLYLYAEVENMKKRMQKERLDLVAHANESLLRNILPVVDNLDFAVKAVKNAEHKLEDAVKHNAVYKNLVLGVDMTLKHFLQTLEQVGVKTVEAIEKPFDPLSHEAISEQEDKAQPDGAVIGELQKGYTLHGRVVRAAKVIVNRIKN